MQSFFMWPTKTNQTLRMRKLILGFVLRTWSEPEGPEINIDKGIGV